MSADSLYSFPASMSSLPAVLALLQGLEGAVGSEALLRAETALEELLTNTVVHGQAQADPDARVWVGVDVQGETCVLRYEDTRGAFDPNVKIAEAVERTHTPLEQRSPGGLGLLMVYRMADAMRYERRGERNCVELKFGPRATVPSDA